MSIEIINHNSPPNSVQMSSNHTQMKTRSLSVSKFSEESPPKKLIETFVQVVNTSHLICIYLIYIIILSIRLSVSHMELEFNFLMLPLSSSICTVLLGRLHSPAEGSTLNISSFLSPASPVTPPRCFLLSVLRILRNSCLAGATPGTSLLEPS